MTRLDGNDWSDLDDIDLWTVDRLLDGTLPAPEVPLGYGELASLLDVVRAGVAPAESGWGSSTVPAMVGILTAPPARKRPRIRPSFVAAQAGRATRAAAAVVLLATLGAGTAAAATGSLPASVQSAVHSAAASLGVSVPDGATKHPPERSRATRPGGDPGVGNDRAPSSGRAGPATGGAAPEQPGGLRRPTGGQPGAAGGVSPDTAPRPAGSASAPAPNTQSAPAPDTQSTSIPTTAPSLPPAPATGTTGSSGRGNGNGNGNGGNGKGSVGSRSLAASGPGAQGA